MSATVNFAPNNQREVQALVRYIQKNRATLEARQLGAAYKQEVAVIKAIMRAYFDKNPPQKIVKICPWKTLGTSEMCRALAVKYGIPFWDILGDANPYR